MDEKEEALIEEVRKMSRMIDSGKTANLSLVDIMKPLQNLYNYRMLKFRINEQQEYGKKYNEA